jgi:hypothetical protein
MPVVELLVADSIQPNQQHKKFDLLSLYEGNFLIIIHSKTFYLPMLIPEEAGVVNWRDEPVAPVFGTPFLRSIFFIN